MVHGLTNVTFEQGDAQVHRFEPGAYDVAVGKFVAMFFSDPTEAFANIRTALRPGGRLITMSWAGPQHNEWLTASFAALSAGRDLQGPPIGVPGPFGMADPSQVRTWLQAAGYDDIDFEEHVG